MNAQIPDHKIIEVICKNVALAYEVKWQFMFRKWHLRGFERNARLLAIHFLANHFDRDFIAEMFDSTEQGIQHYLGEANIIIRTHYQCKLAFAAIDKQLHLLNLN